MMLISEAKNADVHINMDFPLNIDFRNVEVEQIKATVNATLSHIDGF